MVDILLAPAFILIFWQHKNETATVGLNSLYQSNGHETTVCTAALPLPIEGQQGWQKGAAPIPSEFPDALAWYRSDGKRLGNGCLVALETGGKCPYASQSNHFQNKAKILCVLSPLLFVITSEYGEGLLDQMGPAYVMNDTIHCTGTSSIWEQYGPRTVTTDKQIWSKYVKDAAIFTDTLLRGHTVDSFHLQTQNCGIIWYSSHWSHSLSLPWETWLGPPRV